MKKLFTSVLVIFLFVAAQAQTSRDQARKEILGKPRYSNGHTVVVTQPRHQVYTPTHRQPVRYQKHWKKHEYHERHDNGKHLGWYKGKGNRGKHDHDD